MSETGVKLSKRFRTLALLACASAMAGAAQAQQTPPPAAAPVVSQPQAAVSAPDPQPLPPPVWSAQDALTLLGYIRNIGAEGLAPADYDPASLEFALRAGDPVALSKVATERYNKLSSDLALGHVRGEDRIDWWIKDPDLDSGRQDQLLRWALFTHQIAQSLNGLMPTHPQYAALKHALEVTPREEADKINRIRLNMDRWRWLPHDLGERYIIVNVPAYTAALVEKGETISRHHAVAGKISTPTPQLSAMATGVIINPWWEIPSSIADEVAGKKGYVALRDDNGKVIRWRQPPGPSNALGKMKFVMPNSKAIYLHDTNAKSRFNSRVRAYSHGCIRTEDIIDLATILLTEGGEEWSAERVKETLASGKSKLAKFPEPLPVYIVYMSSAANVDGRIIDYPDIYKRDGSVISALLDAKKHPAVDHEDKVATR
ncbi:MAG TPA: L,D-transpeptidase family protein [Sphingomicrobium sp.]|nr:L,D-transpeptidase family protein [Sphingomicrobium sp.]